MSNMKDTTFSIPQLFGAIGDGIADDTSAIEQAILEAKTQGIALKLPQGEYKTTRPLLFYQIDVYCENAKISFYGLQLNVPAIDMGNDVNVYGKLHIWTVDNKLSNHGGRCAMGFGEYGSGRGAHRCYIEDLTMTGGVPNANGVLITGDSSDITFDKVTIPRGTQIGRGILAHWGNAGDYKVKDPNDRSKGIFPVEGARPTMHPHDIHVKKLIATGLDDHNGTLGDVSAFFVSAAYNVTVDEIVAEDVRFMVAITGGDCGLEYATEEERKHGLKNLKFGKLIGKNITTCAAWYCVLSDYLGNTGFYGELEIGEMELDGAAIAVASHGARKVRIGTVNLKNAKHQAVHFSCHTTDVEIDTINLIENCPAEAVYFNRHSDEPANERIKIHTVNVGNGCGNPSKDAIFVKIVDGLEIDRLNLNGASYRSALSVGAECRNIQINQIENNQSNLSKVIFEREPIEDQNHIIVAAVTR